MKTILRITIVFGMLLLFPGLYSFCQVSINNDNSQPDNSAMLDVKSTTKGTLVPRMTQAQIQTIAIPANGLQVFCTTDSKMYIYNATVGQWKELAYGAGTLTPPFLCGMPITINHTAGAVAPVTKTVTYSTVTNISGELSKCWITSNLGADHQATAVDDTSEASAGWYWQFNRKQGYKHDGTTRTPNTIWITSITENFDWLAGNDPCTLELGSPWRLPTYIEWLNVDASGNWTDWLGPWNSGLKMHAAGYLSDSNGSLDTRGYNGITWSSTSYNPGYSWYLLFYDESSYLNLSPKAYGLALRCLRD
ncbi:MAG: hypothetical protein NTX61_09580 [Bacteroidetes bacterium]|nr:hypothetical protein [Bacteroidota bacterium]